MRSIAFRECKGLRFLKATVTPGIAEALEGGTPLLFQSEVEMPMRQMISRPKARSREPFMKCPQCDSTQTQAVRMVIAAGTAVSRGSAIGFGFDGDVAVGFGGATQQTDLARRLDPGPRPSSGRAGVLVVVLLLGAGLLVAINAGAMEVWLIAAAIGLPLVILDRTIAKARLRKWEGRDAFADGAWLCHQCGDAWEP